jgi:general secretion pathway protein D
VRGALAGSALVVAAAASAAPRVYGIERQIEGPQERILVFADAQLSPRYEEHEKGEGELVLEGATLDPSAPRKVDLPGAGNFLEVSVREQRGDAQKVIVAIRHTPGLTPRLVEKGSLLALELPRREEEAGAKGLDLAGRDMSVRQLVTRIARFTDTPVLFDETLQGDVTIVSLQPFSKPEALLLLDTMLLMKGMAAMPTPGGVRKVVRIEGSQAPFVEDVAKAQGDQLVTTLLRLHTIQAESVLQAMRPMIGSNMTAFAYQPTNSIILGGSAALVLRIAGIVESLDAKGTERMFLRPLRYADATNTANQLEDAFRGDGLLAVWPDDRTNTVAVRARADAVPAMRDFLSRVDRPATSRGVLHVMPVDHGDPEKIAEIMMALRTGDAKRIKASRGGAVDPITGAETLAGRSYSVVVDKHTHALVVEADPETASVLRDVLAELDMVPRQVDVEVTAIEITATHGVDLAFDYLLPLTDVNDARDPIAFISGVPSGSLSPLFAGTPVANTVAPLIGLPPPDQAFLGRIARQPVIVPINVNGTIVPVAIPRETAAITAQDQRIYSRMILRPHIVVISGDENEIFVGDNVPILSAQTNNTNPLQTSQSVQRQDVGVDLKVKPTIGEAGGVVLDLELKISAIGPSLSSTTANLGPTILERTLTSSVRLEPDQVAVVGWNAGPASMKMRTGTPWFQDIPVLGWLFRSTNDVNLDSNLIIMVSARFDDPEVRALADTMAREFDREAPQIAAPGALNRPTQPEGATAP